MTAQQIRDEFLKYFVSQGHKVLPSSSLIPDNDATVLLTTAGMQQFKPYFLGQKNPQDIFGAKRVTTIQKAFRTSDIDHVGDTSHLTFFEMLGNFSFGDYWKPEAIDYAWTFLTRVMKLPPERLWITIFSGDETVPRDVEAEQLWLNYVPKERIIAQGRKDNFWGPPGKTGPCGPCSELHWQVVDAPTGKPEDERGEFLELWNLVFMQYNLDEQGKLTELPQKNIDTGLGLERLTSVVQKKSYIFETDIYEPIMAEVKKLPGFGDSGEGAVNARRARIVADHVRGACFLIADGVRFSNKDQGYILRRIVRRAADQFMVTEFSFDKVVEAVVQHFGTAYPELQRESLTIKQQLHAELDQYRKVLEIDVAALVVKMRKLQPHTDFIAPGMSHQTLAADEAFTLYTTHGISLDRLERLGFVFDKPAVEIKVTEHQALSRAGAMKKFGGHGLNDPDLAKNFTPEQIATMTRYHTATHLLHAALRKTLGEEVHQQGSDISPERLRFDFTFPRKLTTEEKDTVEKLVNESITADLPVTMEEMPYQQAMDAGALAFFKEKYGDTVKVYTIGNVSKELCGGPHVTHTAEIGQFKITAEQSVGAGVRRIKASVS